MTKNKEEAKADLLKFYPRGSTVYTICRHVAKSGMLAAYSVVAFLPADANDSKPGELFDFHPNYSVHVLTGRRLKEYHGHSALVVTGCGYDRARHIVDAIARALYDGDERALRHRAL